MVQIFASELEPATNVPGQLSGFFLRVARDTKLARTYIREHRPLIASNPILVKAIMPVMTCPIRPLAKILARGIMPVEECSMLKSETMPVTVITAATALAARAR